MKLVIVESPTKCKTIQNYLGTDYKVMASKGHIKDLAVKGKGGLGVDIEHGFKATYEVSKDKTKLVKELKSEANKSDEVILATDPDREGEAIAYSILNVLDLPVESTKRLEFHEITKQSILDALDNPRTLDMNLVNSQEARRIIDRIMGFRLSTLLRNKIKSKSAGRVQSVALKLICDHEEEILNFKSEKFYELNVNIDVNGEGTPLTLYKYKNKRLENFKVKEEGEEAFNSLKDGLFYKKSERKEKSIPSKEPFRTSTLEQAAFQYFNFSTRETSFLAQELYEGIELEDGLVGLITYIRTDSTRLNEGFVEKAKDYIISNFGKEYYKGPKGNKNVKGQQDAHEAIRPTSLERTPKKVKPYLSPKAYKLYKLIFDRTVASLMQDKKVLNITHYFNNDVLEFKYNETDVLFDGYDVLKLDEKEKNKKLGLNEEILIVSKARYKILNKTLNEEETKAPSRYSEAKLVKMMEENGIGRPSTYSSTIHTLVERKYITSKKGILQPTEQGMLTSKVLTKYFPDLINVNYTAKMEESLDLIQEGELERNVVLKEFYDSFEKNYEEVKDKMYKEPLKKIGEKCPQCGGELVERNGRYGKFISCENYPTCKYVKKEEKEEKIGLDRVCPNCGGKLYKIKSRSGNYFVGCVNFPKCRYAEPLDVDVPKEDKFCPECGSKLVLRKTKKGNKYFLGCSNFPNCKYIEELEKNEKN